MKTPKRPVTLMTLGQIICALSVLLTLLIPTPNAVLLLSCIQLARLGLLDSPIVVVMHAMLSLRDIITAGCIIAAELEAICICGRMKAASAFCAANVKGLGRMVICLALAGLITLLTGNGIMDFLLIGLPAMAPWIAWLLPPFTLLTIALMLRAVQLLMRRALDMQDENQLTV